MGGCRARSERALSGRRLAATLEWADATGDDAGLNRLEREFLEESRTAFARANRRLRRLLALAVLLLVAALVAAAIALAARGSARRQATARSRSGSGRRRSSSRASTARSCSRARA